MMYKKGYSTKCDFCCTLLTAIHEVALALGCELDIRKIRRCSDTGSIAADHLSKSKVGHFKRLISRARSEPEPVPRSLIEWIEEPVPDRFLGQRILKEISRFHSLIGL